MTWLFANPQAAAMHYLPCPCQAEHNAADVPDNICGLGRTSGRLGFQSAGNLVHMTLQPTGTTRNGSDSENGIDSFVVIRMNHAVNEVAAAPAIAAIRSLLSFGSDILAMRARQHLRIMPEEAASLSFLRRANASLLYLTVSSVV